MHSVALPSRWVRAMRSDVKNVATESSTRLELEEWFSLRHVNEGSGSLVAKREKPNREIVS